jgi:hypothetical protein
MSWSRKERNSEQSQMRWIKLLQNWLDISYTDFLISYITIV